MARELYGAPQGGAPDSGLDSGVEEHAPEVHAPLDRDKDVRCRRVGEREIAPCDVCRSSEEGVAEPVSPHDVWGFQTRKERRVVVLEPGGRGWRGKRRTLRRRRERWRLLIQVHSRNSCESLLLFGFESRRERLQLQFLRYYVVIRVPQIGCHQGETLRER